MPAREEVDESFIQGLEAREYQGVWTGDKHYAKNALVTRRKFVGRALGVDRHETWLEYDRVAALRPQGSRCKGSA